jgi:acyl carrier protein
MTRAELRDSLSSLIGEITDRPSTPLHDDMHLVADLALDSMALAELLSKLRTQLKVRLRPADLPDDLRVGRVLDLLSSRLP